MRKILIPIAALIFVLSSYSCGKLFAEENDGGAFEYRDIYLPDYNKQDNSRLGLDYIDEAWGIWGHNLSNVLPEDPSNEIYAKVNGGFEEHQFCFTSDRLFEYISDYVDNQYAFTDSVRFAILPNDNSIVCLCSECVRAGNTKGNASPAVFSLIERLALKYPEHTFYTSYYGTTTQLPEKEMPANSGVIVSAIDYPLSSSETPKEKSFIKLLENWHGKTDRIFVWDYVNNFDDYFTPYPVFTVMQRRLKLYRDAGVTGVFLNGSGNDYSAFSKLKKAVLAELMYNPDQDWKEILQNKASELYPTAGLDIANFIIAQENMVASNGKPLPLYEGIGNALATYLPEKEFIDFYNAIVMHKKTATGQELDELELMTDAMALTMLELKRVGHDMQNTAKLKERLGRLPGNGIDFYNEGCWSVNQYLSNFEFMEKDAASTENTNLLKGVRLIPKTPLDEDYQDITILTDGLLGIPSNYHDGNLLTSADPAFSISIPRQPGMKKLKVWLVYNPGFRIGLPEEVTLSVDGARIKTQVPSRPSGDSGHSFMEFDVPPVGDIILTLKKNPEIKTMAIDEIQAF